MEKLIPCAYYPTTTVFVDDDKDFLSHLAYTIGRDFFLRLYNSPEDALKFLKKEYFLSPFTDHCVVQPEDQSSDQRNIKIDIRSIYWEIFNSKRHNEVATIILDYAMPGLTGAEIAKQLQGTPFKIILLTGEADVQTAIQLFNQGIIHSYIRKDEVDFETKLEETIRNLQYQYFLDLSKIIINSILQYKDFPHKWAKDLAYIDLYYQIRQKYCLLESYLLDEYGSHLFLDEKGKPSILAVTNEEMMETYRDFAENDQAPASVVDGIKSRKRMPFFFSDKDFNVRPAEWEKYMHPANKLQGLETYYYSYIIDPEIDLKNVYSYAEFLKAHE